MTRNISLTATDRAALEQFRIDITEIPTWQLLVTLPLLESSARQAVTPRCLFAVLANHLCKRLHLDVNLVVAHPGGITAGITEQHHLQQAALVLTN